MVTIRWPRFGATWIWCRTVIMQNGLWLRGGLIARLAFNAGGAVFTVPAVIALPKSGK
jgi:hypothetical protein